MTSHQKTSSGSSPSICAAPFDDVGSYKKVKKVIRDLMSSGDLPPYKSVVDFEVFSFKPHLHEAVAFGVKVNDTPFVFALHLSVEKGSDFKSRVAAGNSV